MKINESFPDYQMSDLDKICIRVEKNSNVTNCKLLTSSSSSASSSSSSSSSSVYFCPLIYGSKAYAKVLPIF
ncbi:hypothetical protein GQX74_002371 [Glossina fuscipes]|nr:hypothetical protein GQX74_002371 [Glossina fuscipes]